MGWTRTRVLHSEPVEHWQRVVGSRGPPAPGQAPRNPEPATRTAREQAWRLCVGVGARGAEPAGEPGF